jgi:hypothetical protein
VNADILVPKASLLSRQCLGQLTDLPVKATAASIKFNVNNNVILLFIIGISGKLSRLSSSCSYYAKKGNREHLKEPSTKVWLPQSPLKMNISAMTPTGG